MMKRILGCFFLAASCLSATLAHAQWLYIDLNPPGSNWSEVWGVSDTDQVGTSGQGLVCCAAARWQGTPGSVVWANNSYAFYATDGMWRAGASYHNGPLAIAARGLNANATPLNLAPGATGSIARAAWDGVFGGETIVRGAAWATLWPSIKQQVPAVMLHPRGSASSTVNALDANMQAGVVDGGAATWQGTASSFVDRHPAGYFQSAIYGLHQSTAVGSAVVSSGGPGPYAAVWDLAQGNFSILHPPQYVASGLTGVSWGLASGWVEDSAGVRHAGVWDLATGMFTDLHGYLPAQYGESWAFSIWSELGGTTYVGGTTSGTGGAHAMLWYLPP